MLAMSVIKGTMYACHVDKKEDRTCLPYQFCFGQGMLAIFSKFKINFLQSHFRSNLIGGNYVK